MLLAQEVGKLGVDVGCVSTRISTEVKMIVETPVVFSSHGVPLAGRFFRSSTAPDARGPCVIVTGSWLTVKEQMATLYARELVARGYTSFTFDFSGFGQSKGAPRQAEMVERKVDDIAAAVAFVATMSFVDPHAIGYVGVCASAQYVLRGLSRGVPIRSFVSVAGWYHDAASVAPFYGGAEGVGLRIERARAALDRYLRTGEVVMVPAYRAGDDRAGMFFELDYYADPARGAIPEWKNEMAELTWLNWLSYNGISPAADVATPTLFVHGTDCVLPDNVRAVYDLLAGEKKLQWDDGTQTDFYDRPPQVQRGADAAAEWFNASLRSPVTVVA